MGSGNAMAFGVFASFMWGAVLGGTLNPSTETLWFYLCLGTISMVACVALVILADRHQDLPKSETK